MNGAVPGDEGAGAMRVDELPPVEGGVPARRGRRRRANGWLAITLLLIVLTCQATVLPDTLGLRGVSRAANAFALVCFILGGLFALASRRAMRAPPGYLIAVWLVIVGCAVNVARSLSLESLSAASALLPWTAAASIPFLRSHSVERAWRIFYRFMLVASVVAAVEYAAVFSGLLGTSSVETDRGTYLKGIVTLFYGLDDGSVHYRMYGLFAEPGTYAMYLLPAMAYAWARGKRWPFVLFFGCLYCTDSLGGYFSLAIMAVTYLFWKSRERPIGLLLVVGTAVAITVASAGSFRTRYEDKGASATVREDNVTMFRDNFATIVTSNPFGMPLTGKSLSQLDNVTNNYLGSNFEIYTLFVKGGILACLGYTLLLLWTTVRSGRYLLTGNRDPSIAVAMVCLPAMVPFVVQRETIFVSALFAFLFARPAITLGQSLRAPGAPQVQPAPARRRRRRPPAPLPVPEGR